MNTARIQSAYRRGANAGHLFRGAAVSPEAPGPMLDSLSRAQLPSRLPRGCTPEGVRPDSECTAAPPGAAIRIWGFGISLVIGHSSLGFPSRLLPIAQTETQIPIASVVPVSPGGS